MDQSKLEFNWIKKPLVSYGVFLWFIGVVGYLSNPEKAITALYSGALFGTVSILIAVFYLKAPRALFYLAIFVLSLLSFVFSWRSYVSWQAVLSGNSEKLVAAFLISVMLVASVITLVFLFKNRTMKLPKA